MNVENLEPVTTAELIEALDESAACAATLLEAAHILGIDTTREYDLCAVLRDRLGVGS